MTKVDDQFFLVGATRGRHYITEPKLYPNGTTKNINKALNVSAGTLFLKQFFLQLFVDLSFYKQFIEEVINK